MGGEHSRQVTEFLGIPTCSGIRFIVNVATGARAALRPCARLAYADASTCAFRLLSSLFQHALRGGPSHNADSISEMGPRASHEGGPGGEMCSKQIS